MTMRRSEAGFTLVEVMVALMIVATSIAALQSISSASLRAAVETNHLRVAKMLLRAKAEEIAAGAETGAGGDFEEQGFHGYAWAASEQQLQAGEEESVRSVEVTVRYPTRTGGGGYATMGWGDAGGYVGPNDVGISGDAPGTVRLTVYLDPADAKLEPPQP